MSFVLSSVIYAKAWAKNAQFEQYLPLCSPYIIEIFEYITSTFASGATPLMGSAQNLAPEGKARDYLLQYDLDLEDINGEKYFFDCLSLLEKSRLGRLIAAATDSYGVAESPTEKRRLLAEIQNLTKQLKNIGEKSKWN